MSGSGRLAVIDFIRGLAIADMILVHYSAAIPSLLLRRFVDYTDLAMEGFLAISGYIVGYVYYPMYLRDRPRAVRNLLRRAVELYGMHVMLVCAVALPLALAAGSRVMGNDTLGVYLLKSLLLLKQEGLMHILPTFIPLFLGAIPALHLLARGRTRAFLGVSAGLFLMGLWRPYLFSLGERPIFPVVIWQIYFMLGILAGVRIRTRGYLLFRSLAPHLAVSFAALAVGAWFYFGHHLMPGWSAVREQLHLTVDRFPLNAPGFLYRAALLSSVVGLAVLWRSHIERSPFLEGTLLLIGRHSLLTFAIHVCFAKSALAASWFLENSRQAVLAIIALNILFTLAVLQLIERWRWRRLPAAR